MSGIVAPRMSKRIALAVGTGQHEMIAGQQLQLVTQLKNRHPHIATTDRATSQSHHQHDFLQRYHAADMGEEELGQRDFRGRELYRIVVVAEDARFGVQGEDAATKLGLQMFLAPQACDDSAREVVHGLTAADPVADDDRRFDPVAGRELPVEDENHRRRRKVMFAAFAD